MDIEAAGKDVVGARINLDIAKAIPSFKRMDEGARKNAESFKVLNLEVARTEKHMAAAARAMDKVALTSDERRKKLQAESNALIEQRKAQAELLAAKTAALNKTNEIVDQKLKAQEAIVQKRQAAILQQEREHIQRLAALQSRAIRAEAQAGRTTGTEDNTRERALREEHNIRRSLTEREQRDRERALREEQNIRRRLSEMEQRAAERVARTRDAALRREQQARERLARQEEIQAERIRRSNENAFDTGGGNETLARLRNAAMHATVYQGMYSAIHETQRALKEGLVDIEANMAGYVQTNEHYFVHFEQGTNKMIMDTQRLSAETNKFIQTAHDLGSNIIDVTESARLWGRMYKDVAVVQELVNQSTQLSVVDLVDLNDATKFMESTLAQYGAHIDDVNDATLVGGKILDSWSKVAHDTMAPARDLGAAFERTGKIANETGVSFDFMNGLISAGVRNTALSGENLGNMWKTVLGTIRTEKAVKELESLGVATTEVVEGTERWRKAEDILLDLSIAVIDKNYDLTKSYQDISRGVYQYAKLAASLNVGDILLGTASSISSSGSTMQYLEVQLDTISRKAAQTRTSLLAIFNKAGDDGLRSTLKDSLDVLDQLLIGIAQVPKGVFQATAGIAGLIALYKLVAQPLIVWRNAQVGLNTALAAYAVTQDRATTSTIVATAAMRNAARTTVLATAGITAIVALLGLYIFNLGSAEKAERELEEQRKRQISAMRSEQDMISRQTEFLPKLTRAYTELKSQLDSGKLSVEQQTEAKNQLDKVSKALKITIGEEGLAQLQAARFTDSATTAIITSLNKRKTAINEAIVKQLELEGVDLDAQIKAAEGKLDEATKKAENRSKVSGWEKFLYGVDGKQGQKPWEAMVNPWLENFGFKPGKSIAEDNFLKDIFTNEVGDSQKDLDELRNQRTELEKEKITVLQENVELQLQGEEAKSLKDEQEYQTIKDNFQARYNEFSHLVAIQADGYKTAADQISKLKAIRGQFAGQLTAEDLWGIDEDIYRVSTGKVFEGVGDDEDGTEDDPVKKAFEASKRWIAHRVATGKMTTQQELSSWVKLQNRYAVGTEYRMEADERVYDLKEKLLQDAERKEAEALAMSEAYVSHKVAMGQWSTEQELAALKRIQARYKEGTEDRMRLDERVRETEIRARSESMRASEAWLAHEKAMGRLTEEGELAAWKRMQARYKEGTEERKRADEMVYALSKSLMESREDDLDKLLDTEAAALRKSKDAALKKIEDERDAYVRAKEDEIAAIDRKLAAEEIENQDKDYEAQLAEKKARLKVLESAVGQEGISERRELIKEIAKMEEDHERELRKRGLEADKTKLEDEKKTKEEEFKQERLDTEARFDGLLEALDNFTNDATGRAEVLKNIQIMKDQEKNAEILANLDKFILRYNEKLSAINPDFKIDVTSQSEQSANPWAGVNSSFKFTLPSGMQQFEDGGTVQGIRGRAVPVIAHAGEVVMNERQQGFLAKLLSFQIPQFSMPKFGGFGIASGGNTYHNEFKISSGDVVLTDNADIQTYWTERDAAVNRMQARAGGKTR